MSILFNLICFLITGCKEEYDWTVDIILLLANLVSQIIAIS